MAEFLARLALHFLDRFQPAREAFREEYAPPVWAPIGNDRQMRDLVWSVTFQNFPGGRTQFEAACNSGWVRVSPNKTALFDGVTLHHGYQIEIGPPPGYAPPRQAPQSEEAPPRSTPRPAPDAIAGALKALGYRKLDAPEPAEVKEQFRGLAKRHHPDLAKTPAQRERASARMVKINLAYELLKTHGRAL